MLADRQHQRMDETPVRLAGCNEVHDVPESNSNWISEIQSVTAFDFWFVTNTRGTGLDVFVKQFFARARQF